ncbi:L-histidine N(alpha)-methyltransferase [Actinomadura macra]|uniref:L-histidine N(alpha)-methyltransferase n=1 Tax=Actinomadura macra TaxID=46164 RepID=UPI0009FE6D33|nr:L-histidine N(alpha)-methyltransferase [Actinomadura macra]
MDRFLTADDLAKTLRQDVREGLTGTPKTLPPKWFYDERGSALFEEITRLAEYYPTRREREILVARAPEIAAATRARTLLELGAGSGEKTRLLLDALDGTLHSYIPVDVSGDFLEEAAAGIAADHPDLVVRTVVADYEQHLHLLPAGERRLIAFLGGTIGNMPPAARVGFLGGLRATMGEGDFLLLGADLVKDTGRLVRAYDDAAGVTADFNRNVLRVINRELDADFDPSAFEHVARWDPAEEWIEMRLRSTRDQRVRVAGLDLDVSFAAGEEMRTEVSSKFRRERMESELAASGLELAAFWTDEAGDFSLTLARPTVD